MFIKIVAVKEVLQQLCKKVTYYKKVKNKKQSIAVFASGAGSNAKKIIEHFSNSTIIEVVLIVCNKPDAGVLNIAKAYNISSILIEKEKFFRGNHYIDELKRN